MLALIIAALLPACPAEVTAQPGRAAKHANAQKSRVGAPPRAPCFDVDGHLAIPPLPFEINRARLRPEGRVILAQIAAWMASNPSERLKIHSTYPITWIRSARPACDRAGAVRDLLVREGITPERITLRCEDVLIRGETPAARARQRAASDMWFERLPHNPSKVPVVQPATPPRD